MNVLHVASIDLAPTSGMGRISYEWKLAFEKAGHRFSHLGLKELQRKVHPLFFGKHVRKYILENKIKPDLILAHEPVGGSLSFKEIPLVVFSHGVEERAWKVQDQFGFFKPSIKSRCVPVQLRFYSNNKAFRNCSLALLSNNEDLAYLRDKKGINPERLQIFRNGYYPFDATIPSINEQAITFLYNATWISRKGIDLMYRVFNTILDKYPATKLILAGTSVLEEHVLNGFNTSLHSRIKVVKSFTPLEEAVFYKTAQIFVMPSYFEGQSLALTQAMAMGLCPVAADNCGQNDIIRHRQNGLLFKTGDAKDFLDNIEWLLEHTEHISKLSQNALQSVQSLTWNKVAMDVVSACEAALKKRK